MKKMLSLCIGLVCVLALAGGVQAKTMKLAMDADPVSLDPQVQLLGGMLQYSHMVFDPFTKKSYPLILNMATYIFLMDSDFSQFLSIPRAVRRFPRSPCAAEQMSLRL